jgi:hypothetical protein
LGGPQAAGIRGIPNKKRFRSRTGNAGVRAALNLKKMERHKGSRKEKEPGGLPALSKTFFWRPEA